MKEKEITLKTMDGMEITFQGPENKIEAAVDSLFEETKVDKKAAREIALNSKDVNFVVDVLAFCNDVLKPEEIVSIYNKNKDEVRIVGEIASLNKTPAWIIKELTKYSEESIRELAEIEWEQRAM